MNMRRRPANALLASRDERASPCFGDASSHDARKSEDTRERRLWRWRQGRLVLIGGSTLCGLLLLVRSVGLSLQGASSSDALSHARKTAGGKNRRGAPVARAYRVVASVRGEAEAEFNTDCDLSPGAISEKLGRPVRQTCIDLEEVGNLTLAFQRRRCFYTYVPDCVSASKERVPLVVDAHGASNCPLWHVAFSGWRQKADQNCFLLLWPEGTVWKNVTQTPCWNMPGGSLQHNLSIPLPDCCCTSPQAGRDGTGTTGRSRPYGRADLISSQVIHDPLVLLHMIHASVRTVAPSFNVTVDSRRIYLAGHSNGCMLALSTAHLFSDRVAAVCCHSGTTITSVDPESPLALPRDRAVPVWMAHGTLDQVVRYEGGSSHFLGQLHFPSAFANFHRIADANGCARDTARDADVTGPRRHDGKQPRAQVHRRTNCRNDATVVLVSVQNEAHRPYGGSGIDTTQMAWDFCSSHVLPTAWDDGDD